jgi:hypothetical protein
MRNAYEISVKITERERQFERASRRSGGNIIKMGLKEIGRNGVNWIELAQYSIEWKAEMNTIMYLWDLEKRILFTR